MKISNVPWFVGLALALASINPAIAQQPTPTQKAAATSVASVDPTVLKGSWVRPDGGYTIAIKGISPNGQLDAMYFNPGALPFAKAQASLASAPLMAALSKIVGKYYDLFTRINGKSEEHPRIGCPRMRGRAQWVVHLLPRWQVRR